MSKFREKAEAQTKQVIGQMVGDELLVREGQEQLRHADEDAQDPSSKHDVQTGMPKPHSSRAGKADQGIVRDERGQEAAKGQGARPAREPRRSWRDPPGKKSLRK